MAAADIEKRYIFAVGKQRLSCDNNDFSTVVRLATPEGEPLSPADRRRNFPNRGRAWWMVLGDTRVTQAPPGTLLVAGVELARSANSSGNNKDHYQLRQLLLPTGNSS